jgi:NAD(P)-dependent dehydrogenase (short-subunit alcohol dehydrogenase family)
MFNPVQRSGTRRRFSTARPFSHEFTNSMSERTKSFRRPYGIVAIGGMSQPDRFDTVSKQGTRLFTRLAAAIRPVSGAQGQDAPAIFPRQRVNVLGGIFLVVHFTIPKDALDAFVALIPRGTMGRPEEIATAALFLASSDSRFVTGIELFVSVVVAQI